MKTIGAELVLVEPGKVAISVATRDELTQQNGFLHAGVVATIADSACGYAAMTLMDAGYGVLSVEFKLNLLSPAVAPRIVARGTVVRSGRTLSVCSADVLGVDGAGEQLVATMLATMIARPASCDSDDPGGHDGQGSRESGRTDESQER